MLVLDIKTGDSVKIGEKIKVVVTRTKRNSVKLAISAPIDIKIKRQQRLIKGN